jgi:hypothetical protein
VVVGPVHAAVVLLPETFRARRMQQQLVRALPDVRVGVGKLFRLDVLVFRRPRRPAVVGAKCPGCRDGDVHATGVAWVELDRVAAHPAGAGQPAVTRRVLENAAVWLPCLAAVVGPKQHAGVRSEVKRPGLVWPARLDVPRRVTIREYLINGIGEPALARRQLRNQEARDPLVGRTHPQLQRPRPLNLNRISESISTNERRRGAPDHRFADPVALSSTHLTDLSA